MKPRRIVLTGASFEAVRDGAALPQDAVHHLNRVLRLGAGTEIEITNGRGSVLTGVLRLNGSIWSVDVRLALQEPETTPERVLYAALIKPKRWRTIIEKAVELGVSKVQPVVCQRTNHRVDGDRVGNLVDRWNKLAREAAKQCRRAHVPSVDAPISWESAAAKAPYDIRLFASLGPNTIPLLSLLESDPASIRSSVVLAIGPEGGFTDAEEEIGLRHGFQPISLGPLPLRSETAAIVALGLVSCHQSRVLGDHLGLSPGGV